MPKVIKLVDLRAKNQNQICIAQSPCSQLLCDSGGILLSKKRTNICGFKEVDMSKDSSVLKHLSNCLSFFHLYKGFTNLLYNYTQIKNSPIHIFLHCNHLSSLKTIVFLLNKEKN